jgi:hypothetical protein
MIKIIIRIVSLLMGSSGYVSFIIIRFFKDAACNISTKRLLAFVNQILFDNQLNHVFIGRDVDQAGIDPELRLNALSDLPLSSSGYLNIHVSTKAHDEICSLTISR